MLSNSRSSTVPSEMTEALSKGLVSFGGSSLSSAEIRIPPDREGGLAGGADGVGFAGGGAWLCLGLGGNTAMRGSCVECDGRRSTVASGGGAYVRSATGGACLCPGRGGKSAGVALKGLVSGGMPLTLTCCTPTSVDAGATMPSARSWLRVML